MLAETQTLGTSPNGVAFVKQGITGTSSLFSVAGGTPSSRRALRVSHETTKSGRVTNSLYAVQHTKQDPESATGATAIAAVQFKIIRPAFVSDADMKTIIDQAITGLLLSGVQDKLLNNEV